MLFALGAGVLLHSCTRQTNAPLYVEPSIESELRNIRAIDNHAHPMKVVSEAEQDHDYDALPMEGIQDVVLPAPFSPDNPYFPEAWRALFGYKFSDATPEHLAELRETKQKIEKEKGDAYPSWVLDQANTEIMLANRVAMGRGFASNRFKWVPFADMLLFPLNNSAMETDPDHKVFFRREEDLLRNYLSEAQFEQLPDRLDDYLQFVSHKLEQWHTQGAVAVKFELGYLRDLHATNPSHQVAERVYSSYHRVSEPPSDQYRTLQDFLLRYTAQEAGRLGMPVHFHCSLGGGSYFRVENANPLALEPLFDDPSLRGTKFVMLHGGWPFAREAAALLWKPNAYLDISAFMYMTYPAEAARAIRLYLETNPERVLYGSDASPWDENVGWEETAWIASRNDRLALGLALTAMVQDREITLDRARQICHLVMRDNARALYRF